MTDSRLDPTKWADWQIAEAAEAGLQPIGRVASDFGLTDAEWIPYGRLAAKVDFGPLLARTASRPQGRFVNVTAITPTPLGEGKSTTTIGLIQGLGRRGQKVSGAIRQPSGGPTFNVKGSAAGGGLSQVVPLNDFSLGLTGDIDAVTSAHNLAMVAVTSRLQHEFNSSDEFLAGRGLMRLNIDPRKVQMGWAMDFCAQALRQIIIGLGDKMDGLMMESHFQITVSSEVMAILAVASDWADLRARMGRIVVAFDKKGRPVTTEDLEVAGAMTALMSKALMPNLMQTLEGQPVLVHAGPFANIAIGQSSLLADRVGLALADYHVTESGFAADIGFEKFWNLKCRIGNLRPHASVLVATIRALKMHGGGPAVHPGTPLPEAYRTSNPALVEAGLGNLLAHLAIVKRSGVSPVVCLNHFHTDSDDEVAVVRRAVEAAGGRFAVSKHWQFGGDGAVELADAVVDACDDADAHPDRFQFLYSLETPHRQRVETIATQIYGADGVSWTAHAAERLAHIQADPSLAGLGTCMVKTHLSLSHDPELKGRPTGFTLPVRDVAVFRGAGFVVPIAGEIKLMPGTASDAAFRRIDIDTDTGRVKGMF
jgi:formate--tetrahydrofolate ligase